MPAIRLAGLPKQLACTALALIAPIPRSEAVRRLKGGPEIGQPSEHARRNFRESNIASLAVEISWRPGRPGYGGLNQVCAPCNYCAAVIIENSDSSARKCLCLLHPQHATFLLKLHSLPTSHYQR